MKPDPRASRRRPGGRWHHRARHSLGHSLRVRFVVLFLLLATGVTATFLFGMQSALSVGWRDAARPLVADYVDHLVADIGSPPSVERALQLTRRLPVTVRISGPQVNWQSHPPVDDAARSRQEHREAWQHDNWHSDEPRLLTRTTADGHRIDLGLSLPAWQNQPRRVGWITLAVLLLLTALAYVQVRRLLRPLDDIRVGAERFGRGEFGRPIAVRRRDELGDLAGSINTMANDLHQMLEAKRALLLAISHELRSPLTRARLNTELLPDTPEVTPARDALLRDLAEMRDLVSDLLESERLGQGHTALHNESTDLVTLVHEVVAALGAGEAAPVTIKIIAESPQLTGAVDPIRIKLLVRNLLDNALRHSAGAGQPPEIRLNQAPDGDLVLTVRDFGPGVEPEALSRMAQPFYRTDAARTRSTGGVGLGLYLCRLVAQAHGGSLTLRRVEPGLEVSVLLKQ